MKSVTAKAATRASARQRITRSVVLLALAGVGTTLVIFALQLEINAAVAAMQDDEETLEASLQLGNGVREQYIHEAHTLIEGTRAHVPHYHAWVSHTDAAATELAGRVPQEATWRLQRIASTSREVDRRFRESLLPALEAGDDARVVREHRISEVLVTRASEDADAIAASLQSRMRRSHLRAQRATRSALVVGVVGALVVLGVAGWNARTLRLRVLLPMESLVEGTRRIARGEAPETASLEGDHEVGELGAALTTLWSDLQEREARLVHSERVATLGTMAAAIAHELNNPVGIIRGYLRTMIPEAKAETLRAELSILDEEARACQRLVEDLLSLARQDRLHRASTEISSLVRDAVDRMSASGELGATSVKLSIEPTTLSIDAGRVTQLVSNVIRNAAQALPRTEAAIELEGQRAEGGYRLTCRDRGPGIQDEEREAIFRPFVSGKTTGTGLGLAVCRAIARAHGGTIEAASREGGGAEFRVWLPASEDGVGPELDGAS